MIRRRPIPKSPGFSESNGQAAVLNLLSIVWHFWIVRHVIAPRLYQKGYEQGRKDTDNWWIGEELEVEREWEKMGKEEW